MVEAEEGSSWVYKNKDHGIRLLAWFCLCLLIYLFSAMMSATASLGLSLLWDTEMGLTHMDKYTYSSEEYIKVGHSFVCYDSIPTLINFLGWCLPRHRYLQRRHPHGNRRCTRTFG